MHAAALRVPPAVRREVARALTLVLAGDRSGAAAILRALRSSSSRCPFDGSAQLVLRFVTIRCERLDGEELPAHVCVARQVASDIQRTQQASRGQGTEFPTCDSRKCEQGRAIRKALDPRAPVSWEGAGPGGRFQRDRSRKEKAEQDVARAKLERAGLLEPVRVLDIDRDPEAAED